MTYKGFILCKFATMFIDTAEELANKLKEGRYKNAFITTHHKPDGDAMGSTLALKRFLQDYVPTVNLVTPTDYTYTLHWLPGHEDVHVYEDNVAKSEQMLKDADVIFCLDFNALHRINDLGQSIGASGKDVVMIDHHLNPEDFATYTFANTKISSTCELVYLFIEKYFDKDKIDLDMATCIYTGTVTDTGHFAHGNTTATTHRIAAHLIDIGVDSVGIYERMFNTFTVDRSKLFGYCMYKKIELLPEYRTALLYLDADELREFNVVTGDTEGLVNFGLSIENIVFSVLIIDRTEKVKMSFRSKGSFAANEFAAKFFNGGGHYNAAGGASDDSLKNVVVKFREAIKGYKKELLAV
jgi:phosphoesterase RecJ-like protein